MIPHVLLVDARGHHFATDDRLVVGMVARLFRSGAETFNVGLGDGEESQKPEVPALSA